MKNIEIEIAEIRSTLAYAIEGIKRPAKGKLAHDYLVPAGPYTEQWDWDAFFMGVALTSEQSAEAIYLRNWALNIIENADPSGKVAGCLTSSGWDPRLHQMKPFLAQGAYLAGRALDDFGWLAPHWERLEAICTYRERNLWSRDYDLGVWFDSMESGADNNVAALEFPFGTVAAADLNTFIAREYRALAEIARKLDNGSMADRFSRRSEEVRSAMLRHLWNDELAAFCNLFTVTGRIIPRISYAAFVPLWEGIAPTDAGRRSIERYLLNPEEFHTRFGMRTLTKKDFAYNNVNMIKPYSNWQGPVWPIANYIYMHALLRYGFREQALELARSIGSLVSKDIRETGGMHENYDAESGAPLAAPNFISWNILVRNMLMEASAGTNPFEIV